MIKEKELMETTKVNRNGNSKAINIPAIYCRRLGIRVGDFMDCYLTVKDQIVIIPHNQEEKPRWLKEKS